MTSAETARLFDWLLEHGFTADQANECLHFIAFGTKN